MQKRNRLLRKYFRDIYRALPWFFRHRIKIIREIRQAVYEYISQNNDFTMEEIFYRFGTPLQIAESCISTMDSREYLKEKRLRTLSITSCCVLALFAVVCLSASMVRIDEIEPNGSVDNMSALSSSATANERVIQLYSAIEANYKALGYPDHYAGAYIDEQTQELVILTTDMHKASADSVLPDPKEGVCRYLLSTVSRKEMDDAVRAISAAMDDLHEQQVPIVFVTGDVCKRRVVVGICGLNEEYEQAVLEIANYPFLVFEDMTPMTRHS